MEIVKAKSITLEEAKNLAILHIVLSKIVDDYVLVVGTETDPIVNIEKPGPVCVDFLFKSEDGKWYYLNIDERGNTGPYYIHERLSGALFNVFESFGAFENPNFWNEVYNAQKVLRNNDSKLLHKIAKNFGYKVEKETKLSRKKQN